MGTIAREIKINVNFMKQASMTMKNKKMMPIE